MENHVVAEKKPNPSLFKMFTSPSEQFEKIKENPKIWVSLIIVSILSALGAFLIANGMDTPTLEGISAEQAASISMIGKVTAAIGGLLGPIIAILIGSAVQLIITKIADSGATYKQLLSMNTYIYIIGAVGVLLNAGIRLAIGGNSQVNVTSIAGLLNSDKPGVLNSIELFAIWGLILTAIGLHKVGNLSKGVAWTIAIIFFLISVGMAMLGTAFQGGVGA